MHFVFCIGAFRPTEGEISGFLRTCGGNSKAIEQVSYTFHCIGSICKSRIDTMTTEGENFLVNEMSSKEPKTKINAFGVRALTFSHIGDTLTGLWILNLCCFGQCRDDVKVQEAQV